MKLSLAVMSFIRRNRSFALTSCTMAIAVSANADALLVMPQNSEGLYDYAIQLDANHGLVFEVGDEITLSGISGVTRAALAPDLVGIFASPVITPTSVSLTDAAPIVFDPVPNGVTVPAFSIDSSVMTLGPARYDIETESGNLSGVVQGPVPVPEPAESTTVVSALAIFWVFFRFRRILVAVAKRISRQSTKSGTSDQA